MTSGHGCHTDRPTRSKACPDSVDHDMAAPSNSGPSSSGRAGRLENRGSHIRRAFQALLDPTAPAGSSPLCLITSGGRSPLLSEMAAWATAWGLQVFLRDGNRFGEEIHRAVAANGWDRLRQRVTAADIVVIEHVEAIGSPARLSGFRHLFDAATFSGTRFCLSLATHPATGQFPPDLAGRLGGGLVIPLAFRESPSSAVSTMPARPAAAAGTHPRPGLGRQLSLDRIFAATARHYGIAVETLVGPSRSRTVCHARSLAMYLARNLTDRSFASIGQACGNRDHTTALHGMRTTSVRIGSDPVIAADAAAICRALEPPTPRRRPRSTPSPYLSAPLSMERR